MALQQVSTTIGEQAAVLLERDGVFGVAAILNNFSIFHPDAMGEYTPDNYLVACAAVVVMSPEQQKELFQRGPSGAVDSLVRVMTKSHLGDVAQNLRMSTATITALLHTYGQFDTEVRHSRWVYSDDPDLTVRYIPYDDDSVLPGVLSLAIFVADFFTQVTTSHLTFSSSPLTFHRLTFPPLPPPHSRAAM